MTIMKNVDKWIIGASSNLLQKPTLSRHVLRALTQHPRHDPPLIVMLRVVAASTATRVGVIESDPVIPLRSAQDDGDSGRHAG